MIHSTVSAPKGEKTKYRLAESMKECMKTTPVEEITVRQICEICGVTRQTFYRNFLDKYDLINWYFDKLLVYKAAKLLMDEFDIRQGVDMNLTKFIPVAAGMAGGSSDAAAALVGINRMFQLGLTKRQLMERGVQIGADVPYCVMRGTALAEGIGEKLTSLPGVPMCYVLIGKPGINVSTKFVYGNLHLDEVTEHPDINGMVEAIRNHDLYGITDRMGNVLESVTCPAYPVIDEIKAQMMKNGAVNAMMSGSGPTVFGIFDDPDKAEFARDQLKISGLSKQTFLTTVSKPGGTKYGKK